MKELEKKVYKLRSSVCDEWIVKILVGLIQLLEGIDGGEDGGKSDGRIRIESTVDLQYTMAKGAFVIPSTVVDGNQQDSHEFQKYILDVLDRVVDFILNDSYRSSAGLRSLLDTDTSSRLASLLDSDASGAESIVDTGPNPFAGVVIQTLICTDEECLRESITRESFYDLSFDLMFQSKAPIGLSSCIKKYFSAEVVDYKCWQCAVRRFYESEENHLGLNEAYCRVKEDDTSVSHIKSTKYFKEKKKTKQYHFLKFPKIMVFHFKRLSFDVHSGLPIKINLPVAYDEQIDMSEYLSDSVRGRDQVCGPIYTLYSIIVHLGSEHGRFGHYIAYRKCGKNWWRFNDHRAEEIGSFKDLQAECVLPYMLYYMSSV
jgi:ubiquitin C-terminal hydrolase